MLIEHVRYQAQVNAYRASYGGSLSDAILAHDGQGAGARQAFINLSDREERDLLKFVNSI